MSTEHTSIRGLESGLRHILDRESDGFFGLDGDWRLTHINDRAAELIDVLPDEANGEILWEPFPEVVDTPFERNYRRAMCDQVVRLPVGGGEYD